MVKRVACPLKLTLSCLWMRGFLPAACVLALGIFSTGSWILWSDNGTTGPGTAPLRAALGKGVIMVNWDWSSHKLWIGGRPWTLGVMTDGKGTARAGWYISRPVWSASRLNDVNFALEIHPNHVKVPLLWVWILLAVPPAAVLMWKSHRRRRVGRCPHCGYDLRGLIRALCPECGRPAPEANSRGSLSAAASKSS